MKTFMRKLILLLLLVLPTTLMIFHGTGNGLLARADDAMEGEVEAEDDDEGIVETDEQAVDEGEKAVVSEPEKSAGATGSEEEEESTEDTQLKPSPDVDTTILFTKPVGTTDLPSSQPVRFVVGFRNKGDHEFTVQSMETSFRYPQDYSFFIQNYTLAVYNQVVEASKEASFEYGFTPSEAFNSRPFGLTVLLKYKDDKGSEFQSAVFNETINVVEPNEGLDGETFFLYLFLFAIVVLLGIGAHQLLTSFGKKHLGKGKPTPKIEMGTQKTDVDWSWIPQETMNRINKSPRESPRKRKSKRASGEE